MTTPFWCLFHTLDLCQDNATAAAVTACTAGRGTEPSATAGPGGSNDRRLRSLVRSSITAFEALGCGKLVPGGATGMVLGQNLEEMRAMLEGPLSDGMPVVEGERASRPSLMVATRR